MSNYPADQVLSPPDLPPYLKSVCKLNPIVGVPTNDEVIGIHTVIRVANKVVDVQSVGDPKLLTRLSEHLFNAQMAKYRSKYPCSIFSMNVAYTPPKLPVHVSVNLGPISGSPSEDEVTKVQSAIRSYQRFIDVPSLFDPQVNAELSQHLFDIQMSRYIHSCSQASPVPRKITPVDPVSAARLTEQANNETDTTPNNAGRGSDIIQPYTTQPVPDANVLYAMEQSNQIAERANQLTERSNQLIERSNQITDQLTRMMEQSKGPIERPDSPAEKLTELFGKTNEQFAQSNRLLEASTKPMERLGDILKNMNKVLVGIQHAIVRNHQRNTVHAVDCLVNEKGDTFVKHGITFSSISAASSSSSSGLLPVVIDGVVQDLHIPNGWLRHSLRFHDIDGTFWEDAQKTDVKVGREEAARQALCRYLSSYLG